MSCRMDHTEMHHKYARKAARSSDGRRGVGKVLPRRSLALLTVAAAMALPIVTAYAGGPIQVANVASGTAAFAQSGSVTTITAANNTIINYQKFDIPHGNTVNFIQPSASARVLNRIIGPSPTHIDGTLNANGSVYFVNPAGVMFGAGAVVNVGQLYAAAGHLSDSHFLSGINAFTDNSGSVVNAGVIKADNVTFAARNISNNGTILTPKGMVVLAAGKDIYVSKLGSPFVVQVSGNSNAGSAAAGVSNSGTIDAAGGDVAIRAGDMYSLAINTSGTIHASNISIKAAGNHSTVLVSGQLNATDQGANSTGGTISVNGGRIGIGIATDAAGHFRSAAATLDAAGINGGGKILIGVKPDAASATGYSDASEYDFIGALALLNASATVHGNGGLVDTSGQVLQVSPGAVIQAAGAGGGSAGEWLLDPASITITSSASTSTAGYWSGATPAHGTFEPLSASSGSYTTAGTVDTGTINAALQAGDDVTITTSNGSTGGTGNIMVNATIAPIFNFSVSTTVALSLDAANSITVNNSITSSSTGTTIPAFNVVLNAGESANNSSVTIAAAIGSSSGSGVSSLSVNAAAGTAVTGGTITFNPGGSVTTSGNGQTYSNALTLATNTVLNDTGTGGIVLGGSVNATTSGGASLSINTGGTISSSGPIGNSKELSDVSFDGGGGIAINGGTVVTVSSQAFTGPMTLGASTTFSSTGTGSSAGNLTFGAVNGQGFNITADAAGSTSVITAGGTITDTSSTTNNGGVISINSSGTAVVSSTGSIDVTGNTTTATGGGNAGAITIIGSTGVTVDGNLSAAGGNSSASGSTGGPGGGILISSVSGNISVSGVTINTSGGSDGATSDGGGGGVGIDATGAGGISLTGVSIHTSSQGVGGAGAIAIYSATGTIAITGSTFNSSGAGGGAVGVHTAADVTLSGANVITTSGITGATLGGGGGISGTAASLVVGGGSGNGGAGNGGGVSGGVASAGSSTPNSSAGASTTGGSSGGGAPGSAGALTFTGSGTGNSITVNGPITGSSGPATFSSPTINLNASVTAPSAVTGSGVNTVAVGASGSYQGDIQQGVSLLASGGTLDLTALAGATSADNIVFSLPIKILGPTTRGVTAASWATSVNTAAVTVQGDLAASATTGNGFDFQGATTVSGTTILSSTNSAQVFGGTVTLGSGTLTLNGTTLTANGSPAFSGSGGTLNLGFTATGVSVSSFKGVGTLNFTTPFTFATGQTLVGASGTTTFQAAVTLDGGNIIDTAASGGNVVFDSTLNAGTAADSLAIGTSTVPEHATFDQAVGATLAPVSLTVNGATTLYGNVSTTGPQNYSGAVALGSTAITLSGTTLNASLGSGATFIGGGETLNLDFNSSANLGAISTLGIFEGSGVGAYILNGNITTTGAQNYAGPVSLGATPITLTAHSGTVVQTITFGSTVDGSGTLNVGSLGSASNAYFGGNVGAATNLAALNVSGSTTLTGNVATTGGQTYTGTVTLRAATSLVANNAGTPATVTFGTTIDGGSFALTIGKTTGAVLTNAIFNGPVTNVSALNITGATGMNTAAISTTGGQSYGGTVTLGNTITALTLTDNSFSGIATHQISGTSVQSLTVDETGVGTTTIGGTAGNLNSLTINTGGNITLDGSITANKVSMISSAGNSPISIPSAIAIDADSQSYSADANNAVLGLSALTNLKLADTAGTAAPMQLTLIQGASISDTDLPILAAFIGSSVNTRTYTIQSLDGNISLAGGGTSPVAGAKLVLDALQGSITLGSGGGLNVDSLAAESVSTGAITLNNSVTTSGAQIYDGAVLIGASATLTANNGTTAQLITFDNTVNGNAALNIGSSGAVSNVVFAGAVGGTTSLATLNVSGTASLGGNVTTTGNQTYTGNVTLADGGAARTFTLLAGANTVDFGGTVDGADSGDATLAIGNGTNATNATFGSAIGGSVSLAALSVQGTTSLGGNVTTMGPQTYAGTATLANDAALSGTTLNASPATGAVFTSGHTLTLSFSGNANLGGITSLGSLNGTGAGGYTLNGSITTSGAQNYAGTVTLAITPITLTGTSLNSSISPAVFSGGGDTLTLNFSSSVNLGTITTLGSLSSTGTGTTTLNGNITTSGNQIYSTPVIVASNVTLSGTTLNPSPASSAIFTGLTTAPTLNLSFTNAYNVNFGASSGLGALDLATASLVPVNIPASIAVPYPLTIAGAVTVGQSGDAAGTVITLTGQAFDFQSAFNAASGNDNVVIADAGGHVTFGGIVGGSAGSPNLGALTVEGAADINGGAVNTVNGQIYNGSVTIANSGTTTFTSTQGGIEEDGGITDANGSLTLAPNSVLTVPNPDPILGGGITTGDFRPQSYLTINGSISAGGTVSLAPNAPTFSGVTNPIPDAATIITTGQSGAVTVTGQNIRMGQNQKWTSLTSLTLNADVAGGSNVATLGDLNVAGDLTVNAAKIDMLLRPAGSQLVPGPNSGLLGLHINTPGKEGVDIVANSITLTGAIVPVGSAAYEAPQFAYGPSGTVTGAINTGSAGVHYYGINISPATLMATQVVNGRSTTYYLDLKASGPSVSNVTVAVTPILPPPPPQFNSVVVLSSEQRQILREAGINARNTSIDNLLNLFGGKAVFNDIPTSDGMIIVHPSLLDYYVTTSRLPYQQTRDFITMYRELFLAPVINQKTHRPERDKKGNVVYRSRRMDLHILFRDSFNAYSKVVGAAHATALGYRSWLSKTPGQTTALRALDQLRALLEKVRQLGLTAVELRLSHSTILAELNPEALSERQFEEAVLGHELSNL